MKSGVYTEVDYSEASVIEALLLLGDDVSDPDIDRRVDLTLALRKITRPRAIACLLYARGYTTSEIGRYFRKSQPFGSRLLQNGVAALVRTMNGGAA